MARYRRPDRLPTWRVIGDLPPKPNLVTGEPEPPSAPGYQGSGLTSEEKPTNDLRLFRKPQPPPDLGPVLIWHRDSIKGNVVGYFIAVLLLLVGITAVDLLRGGGVFFFQLWVAWPVIAIGAYLMSSPLDFKTTSVGADWFQRSWRKRWYHRRRRWNYIKTYELTEISGQWAGGSYHLILEDADGHVMHRSLFELQPDRRTWDLIHNGIVHSVANGAQVDKIAGEVLKLDQVPSLRRVDRAEETGDAQP